MARNLFEKAGRIQVPPTKSEAPSAADSRVPSPVVIENALQTVKPKPKTAPGTLMGFMAHQSEAIKENELLRQQAMRFDGAMPARLLDPKTIVTSRWANRHETSFDTPDFVSLKAEIAHARGNVQPIKVRPLTEAARSNGGGGPSNPPGIEYEIIFGHRRHRACLDLNLPVLALIEDVTEQELFIQMERENRNRTDLSAWEQGVMYAKALDQGLYASNRQLATSIGRDLGDVGRALSLARLPQAVIDAFPSPLELQFRWAKPLNDLQQTDPDTLLRRARAVREKKLSGRETLAALLGEGVGPSNPTKMEIKRNGTLFATITTASTGAITVKFNELLDDAQRSNLHKLIQTI